MPHIGKYSSKIYSSFALTPQKNVKKSVLAFVKRRTESRFRDAFLQGNFIFSSIKLNHFSSHTTATLLLGAGLIQISICDAIIDDDKDELRVGGERREKAKAKMPQIILGSIMDQKRRDP